MGDLFSGENPSEADGKPVEPGSSGGVAVQDGPDGGEAVGRTGGRRKGSTNKHDGKLRDYIAAQYGRTPAQELARRAFLDPAVYAKEAGLRTKAGDLDEAQANRRQEKLLVQLLPYTEKRMPTEINVVEERRVGLAIGVVSGPDGADQPVQGRTIDMTPASIRKNQRKQAVSESDPVKSDNPKSDMRD